MTTTIAINCGCGFRVTSDADTTKPIGQHLTANHDALVEAQQHCRETGHTMEILGTVQP